MEYRRNRPRVFLSHSHADEAFVQTLRDDLRSCQIEPWLDSDDIRHGQPWLDAIFESGIPTCDCVLVYMTEHSVESSMVKKEIDAIIVRKLKDSQIAFLPYVSRAEVREKLRPDVQALQAPVWNEDNYHLMLPRVVAEIWHCYMDRTIAAATNEERVKRLEAEKLVLELRQEAGGRVFPEAEDKDLKYIRKALDTPTEVTFKLERSVGEKDTETIQEARYSFNDLAALLRIAAGQDVFDENYLGSPEWLLIRQTPWLRELPENVKLSSRYQLNIEDRLRVFGLIERRPYPMTTHSMGSPMNPEGTYYTMTLYHFEYTYKMQRFRYWLAVNDAAPAFELQAIKPFERVDL